MYLLVESFHLELLLSTIRRSAPREGIEAIEVLFHKDVESLNTVNTL